MKYYVRIGAEAPKVLTEPEIFPLIKDGTVTPTTKACAVGATVWSDLSQLVPQLFQPNAEPPSEGGAMEMVGKAGHFLAEHSGEVASLAKVFTRRIFASNFAAEAALPEERAVLEKSAIPIKSPMAQNYVAWRRAILWVAGIGLALAALITLINEFRVTFGPNVPPVLRLIFVGIQVLNFLAPALVIHAAMRWDKVRHSRRWAKLGWLCQFLGPILLLLIPVKEMTTNEQLSGFLVERGLSVLETQSPRQINKLTDATQRAERMKEFEEQDKELRAKQANTALEITKFLDDGKKKVEDAKKVKDFDWSGAFENKQFATSVSAYYAANTALAAYMTITALMGLLPRVFGMFPGIVRASLTLRTLVPESPLPGYVAALIEPLYILLVLIFVVAASQLGEWLVFDGLVCLLGSGYFLLRNARMLAKPMDSASMTAHLKPLRKKMLACSVAGIVFLVAGFSDYISQIGFWSLTGVVCHLVANIILLTAVGADFLLGLMKFSFDQEQAMKGTTLQTDLENRFADLAQARLATIVDEPPPAVEPAAPK